jgi:hypothetical protein
MKRFDILCAVLVTACIFGFMTGSVSAQPDFTDVSATCGVMYTGFSGRSWDVAFGDYNNDGITDLYCMSHGQGRTARYSLLYRSNASLSLTNVSSTAFGSVTATGGGQGALMTDLDGDGNLDLMTGSNDGVGCVFRSLGNGTFDWYTDFPGAIGSFQARELSQGDMDGDGDLDVIIGVHHQTMRIARNNGSGVFTIGDVSWTGSEAPCGPTLPIVADMDNDGDMDVVSQYMSDFGDCPVPRTITVDFWQNNGSGVFTWVSDTHGLLNGEEECVIMVNDFDNDADLDIVQLISGGKGTNKLFINDGKGYFSEEAASRGIGGNSNYTDWWSKGITGDFDNDGDVDVMYRGDVWTNDGTAHFTRSSLNVTLSGRINGAGDLDGDGDLEIAGTRLYWDDPEDGFWVYRNNTNNQAWLVVRVDAGPNNPYGVGSKISVFDGAQLIGYRQVISSSAMQQPLEQHFGLGSATTVRVEVTFPDGTSTVVNDVTRGQRITVFADYNPVDPSKPTGLAASGSDIGCAHLAWNAPDPAEQVYEYKLAWGPSPGAYVDSVTVPVTDTTPAGGLLTYSQCHLPDGQHCFAIRAHNRYNRWSAYSESACANVTNDNTPPDPPSRPTGFSAADGDDGCSVLSWNTPDPAEQVDEYVLAWGPSQGAYTDSTTVPVTAVSSQGGTSTYAKCDLTDGHYCFVIRAHDSQDDLWSAYSAASCADVTAGNPQGPPAPQNLTAVESDFGCALASWDAVGDPSVTGYVVYYGDQSVEGGQASVYDDSLDVGTDTNAEFCGFAAGTVYFAVKSYTGDGSKSVYSDEFPLSMQGVDDVAPVVSQMTPADGATGVALNAGVFFILTDDKTGVDQSSVTVTVDGADVTQQLDFYGDPSTYRVLATLPGSLPASSTVVVEVTVSDRASPPNQRVRSWSFETGEVTIVDTTPPQFTVMTPSDGATDVAVDAQVRVQLSDGGMGVDIGSIAFTVDGVAVSFTLEGDPYDLTVVYDNADGFTPGAEVAIEVQACDLATPANCGELTDYRFTVRTEVANAPVSGEGVIVPDGFWANDPTKPLEVRNLPVSWTVRIFDTAGREVRDYTNNSADGQDWAWDFTNDEGQRVARAMYLVRVTDPDGKVRQSGRFLVQTDP